MQDSKIIFLYSQSPRSGHNFVAEVIRKIVDCNTPISDRSEIPLAAIIKGFGQVVEKHYKSFGGDEYLNRLFLKGLRRNIMEENKYSMIKYTNFIGAKENFNVFPEDFHIISLRDPKDCLVSLFKGMKFKKDIKSKLKKLLNPTGIYHFSYSRKYARDIEANLPHFERFFILSYEKLVLKEKKELQKLLLLFNSSMTVQELSNRIDDIKIINTSFYNEETSAKKLWEPVTKTIAFDPINRTRGFNKFQLLGIKLGSRSLRKKLGYI